MPCQYVRNLKHAPPIKRAEVSQSCLLPAARLPLPETQAALGLLRRASSPVADVFLFLFFYKLKARPSTSKKMMTLFAGMLAWQW